jgi:hypothetical protein
MFFFAIFGTIGRDVTNPRGTFVENVKKGQNQPTLVYVLCINHRKILDFFRYKKKTGRILFAMGLGIKK